MLQMSKSTERRNKIKKTSNISEQQLLQALNKKKECNAKAQKIVEDLLDSADDPDAFLKKVQDINQSHYEDVVEERSILRLCGYPLCKQELRNIPKKQYQISTINNKVYDITERKKFCSNKCFKASEFVKEQMLTSPLWLRDQEVIPEFKLLAID